MSSKKWWVLSSTLGVKNRVSRPILHGLRYRLKDHVVDGDGIGSVSSISHFQILHFSVSHCQFTYMFAVDCDAFCLEGQYRPVGAVRVQDAVGDDDREGMY